jgi:hypothetical protein
MTRSLLAAAIALFVGGCACRVATRCGIVLRAPVKDYYGTLEPFAAKAVYFVVTDRFVNGDPSNDQRDQGGGRARPHLRHPAAAMQWRGRQHRLPGRRLQGHRRQRRLHPRDGLHLGVDHADRGQPGRSLHRRRRR